MDFREALLSEMQKSKSKLVENREIKAEAKVVEDTEEYLEPRFDGRASFYKKAKVVKKDNGDEELYSYGTHVGGMRDGKPYSKGKWSQTTSRHQKEYFLQKGFDPKEVKTESKLQEEVSDEAYAIADEIANKAQGKGMTRDEFDTALETAKAKYPNLQADDLETDVRGILSYKGFDTDFENGDLKVVESKVEESEKLEERDRSYDGILNTVAENIIPELEFVIENGSEQGLDGLVVLCDEFKDYLVHGLNELGFYDKEKKEELFDIKPNVNLDMQDSNLLSGNTTSLDVPISLIPENKEIKK